MRIDPQVSARKYEREIATLKDQRTTLEDKGIFLLATSTYPYANVLIVPRNALRVVLPATQTGTGLVLPQNTFVALDVPSLAARAFTARFDLTDYDISPPSVEFLDPWTGQSLDYATMFRALEFEETRKAHVVLLGDHPGTHKPFLCLRGVREYHEHPQHSGDDWLLYRREINLFSLVLSVWRVSVDLVRAHLGVSPPNVQVQWIADEKL